MLNSFYETIPPELQKVCRLVVSSLKAAGRHVVADVPRLDRAYEVNDLHIVSKLFESRRVAVESLSDRVVGEG
jgi:DNA invertase Pin-like site-specific DNA recombinase